MESSDSLAEKGQSRRHSSVDRGRSTGPGFSIERPFRLDYDRERLRRGSAGRADRRDRDILRLSLAARSNPTLASPSVTPRHSGQTLNSITPTSGLEFLLRRGVEGILSRPVEIRYDANGNVVETPLYSPLRQSLRVPQLETIADRMREAWVAANGEHSDVYNGPCRLLALPDELHLQIISLLGLGDLERLRRTCTSYHRLLSPEFVRDLFARRPGGLEGQFARVCQDCFANPDRADELILQPQTRPRSVRSSHGGRPPPLTAKCLKCSVRDRDCKIGQGVVLANGRRAWTCRWCGWPVTGKSSWASEQFHRHCYDGYIRIFWKFMILGFVQLAIGVVATALSLHFFRDDPYVFIPAVINLVLLCVCMLFLMLRGNRVRTYIWTALVELTILGLWVVPLVYVSRHLGHDDDEDFAVSVAALVFYGLNILFRFLNTAGNVILIFEWDLTKRCAPDVPTGHRIINWIMTGLILWTYPPSVEQRYPPDYN